MSAWLTVLGIAEDGAAGLTPTARAIVESAEFLIGGERHLALLDGIAPQVERMRWRKPLSASLADLERLRGRRLVVLASGDPMHYGVGATLAREFGPDALTVIPAPSSFSLAAARLGWALQDAACLSLHGRPEAALALHLAPGARLLALTEDADAPARIATVLVERGFGASVLTVLERLGGPYERIFSDAAESWKAGAVDALHVLAIECRAGPGARSYSRAAGLPDDAFRHDGQITKQSVRAATLALLAPLPFERLWDIGAGAGSVAIEWLRIAPGARAIAIEPDPTRRANIAHNAAFLGVPQLEILPGEAPAALAGLPAPDAVFIGGGVAMPGVIEAAWQALAAGGRIVANAVTLEGERALIDAQARFGGRLIRLALAEAEPLGAFLAFRPQLPVTQWCAVRGGDE